MEIKKTEVIKSKKIQLMSQLQCIKWGLNREGKRSNQEKKLNAQSKHARPKSKN